MLIRRLHYAPPFRAVVLLTQAAANGTRFLNGRFMMAGAFTGGHQVGTAAKLSFPCVSPYSTGTTTSQQSGPSQLQQQRYSSTGVVWTAEEDLALQLAVQRYGANWSRVVASLPGKTPYQCKVRWREKMLTWRNESKVGMCVCLALPIEVLAC